MRIALSPNPSKPPSRNTTCVAIDTGTTARAVRDMLPSAHFATIYAKPAGRPLVDTFITEVSQDTWILFPWDTESQFVQPIIDIKQQNP